MRHSMEDWIEKYGKAPKTIAWLENNPPPEGWEGSPEEYAYEEMPPSRLELNESTDELRVRVGNAVKRVRKGMERSKARVPIADAAGPVTPGEVTPGEVPAPAPGVRRGHVEGFAQSILDVCKKKS